MCISGMLVVAYQEYGSLHIRKIFMSQEVGGVMIMRINLLRYHQLAPESSVDVTQYNEATNYYYGFEDIKENDDKDIEEERAGAPTVSADNHQPTAITTGEVSPQKYKPFSCFDNAYLQQRRSSNPG